MEAIAWYMRLQISSLREVSFWITPNIRLESESTGMLLLVGWSETLNFQIACSTLRWHFESLYPVWLWSRGPIIVSTFVFGQKRDLTACILCLQDNFNVIRAHCLAIGEDLVPFTFCLQGNYNVTKARHNRYWSTAAQVNSKLITALCYHKTGVTTKVHQAVTLTSQSVSNMSLTIFW